MKRKIYIYMFVLGVLLCSCHSSRLPVALNVASYNLRNANGVDSAQGNGWGERCAVIAQMVQFHDFDIFGAQECFFHQLQEMKKVLPHYDYIGVGRDEKENMQPSSIVQISLKYWKKETSGCRKHRMCRVKDGMQLCRVFVPGDISDAKKVVLNFYSSTCIWIISARRHG